MTTIIRTIDVPTMPGNFGPWNYSTILRQDIRRSLSKGWYLLAEATLGQVKYAILVMSPADWCALLNSQEMAVYLKSSLLYLNNPLWNPAEEPPANFYGVRLRIEGATIPRLELESDGTDYIIGFQRAIVA